MHVRPSPSTKEQHRRQGTGPGACMGIVTLAVALLACKESPEKSCKRYIELKRSAGKPAGSSVETRCRVKLGALKRRSGKAWGCTAGCIKKATSLSEADQCPWSCERQYGNNGEPVDATGQRSVARRWKRGIVPSKAKDAVPAFIREKAAAEAAALRECIPKCKRSFDPYRKAKEYRLCLSLCKAGRSKR